MREKMLHPPYRHPPAFCTKAKFAKGGEEGIFVGHYGTRNSVEILLQAFSLMSGGIAGTAGTTMAILAFERENGITWILTYVYIMK